MASWCEHRSGRDGHGTGERPQASPDPLAVAVSPSAGAKGQAEPTRSPTRASRRSSGETPHPRSTCLDCERCTWNPGPDCGKAEHPHCETCGHCLYRHY